MKELPRDSLGPSNWIINNHRNLFHLIFSTLFLVVKRPACPQEPSVVYEPTQSGLWNKIKAITFNSLSYLQTKTTMTRLLKIWLMYWWQIPWQHESKETEAKHCTLNQQAYKVPFSLSFPTSLLSLPFLPLFFPPFPVSLLFLVSNFPNHLSKCKILLFYCL